MTIPTGFVKSMSHASGAARRAVSSAMSSTTGTVRNAFAKPPAPVVSWPMAPNRGGSVSSTRRAAWPPIRSWTRTNAAPSMRLRARRRERDPAGPAGVLGHPSREAADDREPLLVDIEQRDLRDREVPARERMPSMSSGV